MAANGPRRPPAFGLRPPLTPGPERRIHLRKPGRASPASAPDQVQGGDRSCPTRSPPPPTSGAAATAPSNPRGYDCSGAVSFALNGGGLPRKPARLDRPRDPGAKPAPDSGSPSTPIAEHAWIDHRRPRLRHRRWPRPALGILKLVDSPEGFIARHPARALAPGLELRLGAKVLGVSSPTAGSSSLRANEEFRPLPLGLRGTDPS